MTNHKTCDVLSCIQPTGEMHIGNYFGAVKNWVSLQSEYECVYGIVDLHAMTKKYDPEALRRNTDQMVLDLLACGIDPGKSIVFVQSLVPEHVELSWILSNVTPYGELTRQTQFKDQQEKGGTLTSGFFTYPVLQAADILIYNAKYVPVGKDQRQHLELSRNIAEKFNHRYSGNFFNLPEPIFTNAPKVMSPADPARKMSKSAGEKHFIRLFADETEIRKKIKSAVTDSGDTPKGEMSPGVKNMLSILDACDKQSQVTSLLNDFRAGQIRYSDLKDTVGDALIELSNNLRSKRKELERDTTLLNDTIREMSSMARELARETLYEVKKLVGIKNVSHF